MKTTFKNNILEFLSKKMTQLEKSQNKKIIVNKEDRIRDLSGLIKIIENSKFVECDKLEIDSYLLIQPIGDGIESKIYYTKEIYDLDINIATIKIASEFLLYYSAALVYKTEKQLSYIYLYLLHLTLIDTKMAYYSQSFRSKIYNKLLESEPRILELYNIEFNEEKINYYIKFALKNRDNYVSPFLCADFMSFSNGNIFYYNTLFAHVTQYEGFNLMCYIDNEGFGSNFIEPLYLGFEFEEYVKKVEKLKAAQNTFFRISKPKKSFFVDNNFEPIKDKKIIRSLREQFKLAQALCM